MVFRFRSIQRVLDKNELENQTIYLSSPSKLNDPLEGYQDVFWSGDAILWENLLRHYVLSLLWCQMYCLIANDDSFEDEALQVTLTRADLPTDQYRSIYEAACSRFFSAAGLADLPNLLSTLRRPLRRNSLQAVLALVHQAALEAILGELEENKLIPRRGVRQAAPTLAQPFSKVVSALDDETLSESEMESLLATLGSFTQGPVIDRLTASLADDDVRALKKFNFLVASFPQRYIQQISDTLIHTNWQTACFSKTCVNPSMWAAYGGDHRGVALMFKLEGQPQGLPRFLPVRGTVGWGGSKNGTAPIEGDIRLAMHEVSYTGTPPQIDFFRFLGRLPRTKLLDTWHSDRKGNASPLIDEILSDEDSWRNDLWKRFHTKSTTKMSAWAHEEECRVVMSDIFDSHAEGRAVTFQLDSLAGVVFGLRTSLDDKVAIARILNRKCGAENREPVPLYQMVFDGVELRKVEIFMGRSRTGLSRSTV